MQVRYIEKMQPDGSWKKIPVFIAETEQESIEAGERARNVPGYYAGFPRSTPTLTTHFTIA